MRKTVPLQKMDLALSKEEEKTKVMDTEEGMIEKHKNKVKLHCLRIPLVEKRLRRKGRLLQTNLR
jgi:hypothetical protein